MFADTKRILITCYVTYIIQGLIINELYTRPIMFNSILLHGNIYFRHWDLGQQGVTQVGIYLIGPTNQRRAFMLVVIIDVYLATNIADYMD